MKKISYYFIASIVLLASCSKTDVVENTQSPKTPETTNNKNAYLKILNVTPSSPTVNFYIDGAKLTYAQPIVGFDYPSYSYNAVSFDFGYSIVSAGNRTLSAKIIASATTDANLEVFSQTITPDAGKYYTIFTTGNYTSKKIPSSVIVEDKTSGIDPTKILIRVANFYNGSTKLDLFKESATGTKIVSDIAYGTISDWVDISALTSGTNNSIKVVFNSTTASTPLISTETTLTLSKGRAYTLYTSGVLGNTNFPLTTNLYTTSTGT